MVFPFFFRNLHLLFKRITGLTTTRRNYKKVYSLLLIDQTEFNAFPINNQLLDGLATHLVDRLKWFTQGFYTVAERNGKIRMYNMQCDMQGVQTFGDYKTSTAFYYKMTLDENGGYDLRLGMHPKE